MNEQQKLLALVVAKLEEFEIPYMITGSVASSAYGKPRTTEDIDIVIDPQEDQLKAFMLSFEDRFYADASMAADAFRSRGMYNIIDTFTGYKVDLIMEKKTPHSTVAFGRRQIIPIMDCVRASTVSPEDIILQKLVWSRGRDSERQWQDVFNVIAMSPNLDMEYMRQWARELNVSGKFEDILSQSRILRPESDAE